MRVTGLLGLLLVGLTLNALHGQAPGRWARSVYPTGINLSGNTGPQVGVAFSIARGADSLARYLVDASVVAAGGYGLRGSWFGSVALRAPGLWPGWRLVASGLSQREERFEFLGVGNQSVYEPDSVNPNQPYFYKMRRTRYRGSLEATRGIGPGRYIALAVGISYTRFDSLPGRSVFLAQYGPALVEVDRTARLSLVLDHRNNEYDPNRGWLVELSAAAGSGGSGYTRFTAVTRAYLPFGAKTVAASRFVTSRVTGRPPLSARFELPVWEGWIDVLGGPESHRGLRSQRFVGRDVEFGTVELRRSLFFRGERLELLGAAFMEFGRVFEAEDFDLTIKDLKIAPGLGLVVRFKGKPVVSFYAARGPDGIVVTSRTGWVF